MNTSQILLAYFNRMAVSKLSWLFESQIAFKTAGSENTEFWLYKAMNKSYFFSSFQTLLISLPRFH